ncbi:MAG TPA: hypothetical protein VGD40_10105 [Chryseosolibacter sp.]
MANVPVHKIQFVGSNPFGEFAIGDELTFYYDNTVDPNSSNVSEGITVYKNGVLMSSGAMISLNSFINSGVLVEKNLEGDGTCNGTYLIQHARLDTNFPYLINVALADYPGCAINAPTCNLFIVGVPQIVNATAPTSADGEILVQASSSLAMQFKLNSDFVYGDGSGQSTGEFIGLVPGQYRVYVRDSANCFANVQVTVGVSNEYGPLYRLDYTNPRTGIPSRIDIAKRDYLGSVTDVVCQEETFERSLTGEASLNKFETILATKAVFKLISTIDEQFQGLYTNSPDEFRIYFYKGLGLPLRGVYKVLPQQYEEDFTKAPYPVMVIATDGLPTLKDFAFLQGDGQRFHGSLKAIELLAYVLKKTGLRLNIRVGINMYATGMDTAASSDPLDQAYVDTDNYYINNPSPTLDYVLREIIKPYGASIIQEYGVWNIVRVEEKVAEYDYREFDPDGVYVSNSSYDPIVHVKARSESNRFVFSGTNAKKILCPGYGKIRCVYKLGLRDNILENGDFRLKATYSQLYNGYFHELDTFGFQLVQTALTPIASTWEPVAGPILQLYQSGSKFDVNSVAWKIEGGPLNRGYDYIQSDSYNVKMGLNNTLKIKIRFKVPAPVAFGLGAITIPIPYQRVRMRVKYGDYYLLGDGTWTTEENIITFFITEFEKYTEQEIVAVQPHPDATSGYDFDVRIYHSFMYYAEFGSWDDLRAEPTYSNVTSEPLLPTGTKTEAYDIDDANGNNLRYYELEETTEDEAEPSILRPLDYHPTNNPRQWVMKKRIVPYITNSFISPFWIDYITVEFLTDGTRSYDAIIREVNAEPRNKNMLDVEVCHGSYQSLISTIPVWDYGIGKLTTESQALLTLVTSSVLSADILYAGYFRKADGTGWETWTRDGMPEMASMHEILLRQYAAQYNRSWRKLVCTLYSDDRDFSLIDVIRVASDGDRIYLPISPTIEDKSNTVSGEFLELMDASPSGTTASAFTKGFSFGGFR